MRSSNNPKTTLSKKTTAKIILYALAALVFTIGNAIALICNIITHQSNRQLKASIEYNQLQTTYAEDCQIIGDYIPKLTPPLIRYQDEAGQEHLYYCTHVNVNGPSPIEKWEHEAWSIRKSGTEYSTRRIELPAYDQIIGQTLYHAYDDYSKYSNEYTPMLETYSIYETNGFYHEIESKYKRIPSRIDIGNPDAITTFLAEQGPPTATIYSINILQPTPDQVNVVSYDAENVILDTTETACCDCIGCCCEVCKCKD